MAKRSAVKVIEPERRAKKEILKLLREKVDVIEKRTDAHSKEASEASLELITKRVGELWEDLSGIASMGEAYTFDCRNNSSFLKNLRDRLINGEKNIPQKDVRRLFAIYRNYFRELHLRKR